ncbi:MAG: class I SAM-dependent methyltransferase [Treponemataceae bacterium]|nr:class I SAM-dependent methyltransferase [Treponemataceae bacterium]
MSEANVPKIQSKTEYQAELLANRLSKRYKHLRKWASRTGVLCYRLYDKDIPEIPLAIDIYEEETTAEGEKGRTYARIALYERPYEKLESEEQEWLHAMEITVEKVLGLQEKSIITKVRKRQSGDSQYEKRNGNTISFITEEQGLRFRINLSDYIDTGLFFDHRPLRLSVREEAQDKRILNLFCYTGAFSVYAAAGNAAQVDSVDLSGKYLAWAEENMSLNGFTDKSRYRFIESDVSSFLRKAAAAVPKTGKKAGYDIIILDPPTFSNSKKTDTMLDINRDWPYLIKLCTDLLSEKGILYFSTNSRKLSFDEKKIPQGFSAKDISRSTIPEDFRNEKIHKVWKIEASPLSITRHCELVHGYFPEHP